MIAAARDRARVHLRAGEDFVWNATNVSRQLRGQCASLAADYRARVEIVGLETPPDVLRQRNRARDNPVPDKVIDRLIRRWEAPDPTEAHRVEFAATAPARHRTPA